MPFALSVKKIEAPTELYDLLGEEGFKSFVEEEVEKQAEETVKDLPKGNARDQAKEEAKEKARKELSKEYCKHTEVFVTVSVYRNVINWFVIGEMNKDAQSFRDEIYKCAALAHRELERGCGGYYRGTNSVHVKRQHSDAFEAMYNHNHYPLGAEKGADVDPTDFPEPVTPEEFEQHMLAFSKHDAKMHGGTPRFLTEAEAKEAAKLFRESYKQEGKEFGLDPNKRTYTDEDIKELKERAWQEQPCKPTKKDLEKPPIIRGIDAKLADTRQPDVLIEGTSKYDKTYLYVAESRAHGKKRELLAQNAKLELAIKNEIQKELSTEYMRNKQAVSVVQSEISPNSATAISAQSFTHEGVSTAMSIGLTDSYGVLNELKGGISLEKREQIRKKIESELELKEPKQKNKQALRLIDTMITILSQKKDVASQKELNTLKMFRSEFENSMRYMKGRNHYELVDAMGIQKSLGFTPEKGTNLEKIMLIVYELTEQKKQQKNKM